MIDPNLATRFREAHEREAVKTAELMAARGDFKIQLTLHSTRSIRTPLIFSVNIWESGKREHGGGDVSCSFCWRQNGAPLVVPETEVTLQKSSPVGCKGVIRPQHIRGNLAICPHCMARHRTEEIGDTILYSMYVDDAAETLYKYWQKLECRADVVIQYASSDIRQTTRQGRDALQVRQGNKGAKAIYPLANILKDTLGGASVTSRFRAFLLA